MPDFRGRASPSDPVGLDDVNLDVGASYPRRALPPLGHNPSDGADEARGLAILLQDSPAKGSMLPHIGTPPGGRRLRGAQGNEPLGRRDKLDKVGRQLRGKPVAKPVTDLVPAQPVTFVTAEANIRMMEESRQAELTRHNRRECDNILMECWLNDVLTQRPDKAAERDLQQISTASLAGLTSYGLSREELSRDGLSAPTIERVYRALYVYTIGFHDTMKDLFVHAKSSDQVVRKVWKSFASISETALKLSFKSDFLAVLAAKDEAER
eukprot:CAMPEP_0118956300 /NCGR_PEP_ID=MMETSP1169-20130426/61477_1 /TAXON_ID=36882 /ORGANISM="Pyramimonas obovata, Strain CCMP722" /LENGTH=266 /DNA_ID=CAMNT_0006904315 /DNA_START=227 /DNA_END=1024 /DNA_ORIENTATION=+